MIRALSIGLTSVDPHAYSGWNGENGCWGCERDVIGFGHDILDPAGAEQTVLLTMQATRHAVEAALVELASETHPGDTAIIYRTGHGGRTPDLDGDEADGWDETWVLWDGEMIDDTAWTYLLRFPAGANVVMISDTCESGTPFRTRPTHPYPAPRIELAATLIHMGACHDGHYATGLEDGGIYTTALREVYSANVGLSYVELQALTWMRVREQYRQRPSFAGAGPSPWKLWRRTAFT